MKINFEYTRATILENGHFKGCFAIHNLLPDQAQIIGNALRRVLLMNTEGTAITGIKILNVPHEFAIIPGIREDILEIILNLKQIVIKTNKKELFFGKISINGPGIITGKSITFDSDAVVINSNQYIATVLAKTDIKFDIILEQNLNYHIDNQLENKNSDFIKIDATFMPIVNVSYGIHDISYCEPNKISKTLIFEIITNGSITPEHALREASLKLKNWFDMLNLMIT